MRAFARGGCQTLGLRVGRLCCNHGRPFLYGLAYVTRLPTSPGRPQGRFPGSPCVRLHVDNVWTTLNNATQEECDALMAASVPALAVEVDADSHGARSRRD